jgi:hypothetical protein
MLAQGDYTTSKGGYATGALNIVESGRAIAQSQSKDEDRFIQYRRQYTYITCRVTAAILLQQIRRWWFNHDRQPFYKFREPCEHDWYREGDSWTEELAFSPAEFDTALKTIGTKITKGVSKANVLRAYKLESLVLYWTDSNRVTWYQLNEPLFFALIHLAYNQPELLGKSGKSNYLDNPTLIDYLDNGGLRNYLYSENTPEITSQNTIIGAIAPAAAEPRAENPSQPSIKEKRDTKVTLTPEQETERQRLFPVIAEVCKYDLKVAPSGLIGKVAKNLAKANYTAGQVKAFYSDGGWWYKEDWRGQKGQVPKPGAISETILQATEWARANYDAKRATIQPTVPKPPQAFHNSFTGCIERGANGNGKQSAKQPTAP